MTFPNCRVTAPQGLGMRINVRRVTLLCVAVTAAIGAVDAVDTHLNLIGFLAVGPFLAILTRRVGATAVVGAWAIGLAILLGAPDQIWGTTTQLAYAGSVALVASLSTTASAMIEGRPFGSRRPSPPPEPPAPDADTAFVTAAYLGIFLRPPDPGGLAHHLSLLRAGTPRDEVLARMVESTEAARHLVYSPGLRGLAQEMWLQRQQVDPSVRPIYFLHIMKTGGTALNQSLAALVGPWPRLSDLFLDHLVCLPRPLLAQAILIAGHLPLEAVELLPAGGALCTVIREPVDRTLSHLAHLNGERAGQGQPAVSLEEFISEAGWGRLWQNYQAHQLVGRLGLSDVWTRFSPPERAASRALSPADRDFPLQSLFDNEAALPAGDLDSAALAALESIDLVGTTDDLDGLLARVARFWHLPPPAPVPRVRVSPGRSARADVPAPLLAAIEAGTLVDAALYRRAQVISGS